MRKTLCLTACVLLACVMLSSMALAQDQSAEERRKAVLANNINSLRTQEVRVAVLQQMLNEEISRLMQVQAVFCDQYNLDVQKFRQGMYQYNADTDEFIIREQAAPVDLSQE